MATDVAITCSTRLDGSGGQTVWLNMDDVLAVLDEYATVHTGRVNPVFAVRDIKAMIAAGVGNKPREWAVGRVDAAREELAQLEARLDGVWPPPVEVSARIEELHAFLDQTHHR